MPVVSYASLSASPPLVGVSCDPRAFTYIMIAKAGIFSLCFLDRKHLSAVEFLATHSGRISADKLADSGLGHHNGTRLDVPVITESVASLECALVAKKKFGDHVLVVGEVEAARASADFGEYWRFNTYRPILYAGWQGRLSTFRS